MRRTPSSGCYWGFVLCLRDTLYLFLAIAIIAYALRQIKFTQLLYFLYVSLNFLRNFYFYAFYTFFFFFYLFIRHIDIYMFPMINFLKNLQRKGGWNSISYKDNSIPVLLGSEYKSFYKIGDIITGNYYSKNTNFEVIGFIETDCSINYKNTSNITLDTYMLIPYPSTLWEVDKTNFQFESLLYFAMINCDLLPFVEESQILKNIKSISDETGFSDFSLVGIDNFQIQHIELLLFIQKHHILFIIGFLIIFILLNILCLYLFNHILKSICNQSTLRKKHNKIFMLNIVIPYGSAFLLGTSLATLFIKKILPISIIIGIITLVLIYLINYLFLSKFLHVSSNLQQ